MELCRPTLTLSRTVMSVNRRIFWKVRAMPSLLTLYTGIPLMSMLLTSTEPRVG